MLGVGHVHNCFSGSRLEFSPLDKIQLVVCEVLPVCLKLKIYIKYQFKKKGNSLFQVYVYTALINSWLENMKDTVQQHCLYHTSCHVRADPCSQSTDNYLHAKPTWEGTNKCAELVFPVSGRGSTSWSLNVASIHFTLLSCIVMIFLWIKCCTNNYRGA